MQFAFSIVAIVGFLAFAMAAPAPQGAPIGCVQVFDDCEGASGGNANAITACSLTLAQCESGVA